MIFKSKEYLRTQHVVEKSTQLVYLILHHTPKFPLDSLLDPFIFKLSVNTWRSQVIKSIRYFTMLYISGLLSENEYMNFIKSIEHELEKFNYQNENANNLSKCFVYISCVKRRLSCSFRLTC